MGRTYQFNSSASVASSKSIRATPRKISARKSIRQPAIAFDLQKVPNQELKDLFKHMLAQRNIYKFTIDLPNDIITILSKMDNMEYKIGRDTARLRLLHRDTQIKIENPLKISNSFLVGKAIGIIFLNTRFKKSVYNLRDAKNAYKQQLKDSDSRVNKSQVNDFITIK